MAPLAVAEPQVEAAEGAPAAVVLAAGQGTRMRSRLPKVVHPVAGRPMAEHVVRAAREAGADPIVVVVGHGADAVRSALAHTGVRFAVQERQLGTGHALACARPALPEGAGAVFVLNGDGPLVTGRSLQAMARLQGDAPGMTMMTCRVEDPSGLGRVLRDADGAVRAIVEEKDANEEERRVREINPGVFLFDDSVWRRLRGLSADNVQGELYITDLPADYLADGLRVRAYVAPDPREGLAANDRVELAVLERELRDRVRRHWMRRGVTMVAPETVFLDEDVELARDVVLEPFTVLAGATRVEEGAHVGAGAHLTDCRVAPGAVVAPHTLAQGRIFGAED